MTIAKDMITLNNHLLDSAEYWMLYLYARYIAEQALEDAVKSNIYVCGMQPIGEDHPCHDIFQCYLNLHALYP